MTEEAPRNLNEELKAIIDSFFSQENLGAFSATIQPRVVMPRDLHEKFLNKSYLKDLRSTIYALKEAPDDKPLQNHLTIWDNQMFCPQLFIHLIYEDNLAKVDGKTLVKPWDYILEHSSDVMGHISAYENILDLKVWPDSLIHSPIANKEKAFEEYLQRIEIDLQHTKSREEDYNRLLDCSQWFTWFIRKVKGEYIVVRKEEGLYMLSEDPILYYDMME